MPTDKIVDVIAPFVDEGWTVRDLEHALDHTPEGDGHWQTARIKFPKAWLNHRLTLWRGRSAPITSR